MWFLKDRYQRGNLTETFKLRYFCVSRVEFLTDKFPISLTVKVRKIKLVPLGLQN